MSCASFFYATYDNFFLDDKLWSSRSQIDYLYNTCKGFDKIIIKFIYLLEPVEPFCGKQCALSQMGKPALSFIC